MRGLVVAMVLAALGGCVDDKDVGACPEGTELNPHDEACVNAVEPQHEVCNAWIDGESSRTGTCNATSQDGRAWLDIDLAIEGTVLATVRDSAGTLQFEEELGTANRAVDLEGAPGAWRLTVDFNGANGSGRLVLWG